MTHPTDCTCRRCGTARHHRLVRSIKAELSSRFRQSIYVDDVTQYHGRTVRRNGDIGPWVDAGMASGTFDLFVCAGGRAVFLDIKTGGAKLTKQQIEFQSWIRAAGGVAEPVRSVEEAVGIVAEVMGR